MVDDGFLVGSFTLVVDLLEVEELWVDFELVCDIAHLLEESLRDLLCACYDHRLPTLGSLLLLEETDGPSFVASVVDHLSLDDLRGSVPAGEREEDELRQQYEVFVVNHIAHAFLVGGLQKRDIVDGGHLLLLDDVVLLVLELYVHAPGIEELLLYDEERLFELEVVLDVALNVVIAVEHAQDGLTLLRLGGSEQAHHGDHGVPGFLIEEEVDANAQTVVDELLLANGVTPLAEEVDAQLEDLCEVPHCLAAHLILVVCEEAEEELQLLPLVLFLADHEDEAGQVLEVKDTLKSEGGELHV